MLTVDDYERIRRSVLVDGKSQREVARELGHSRHTVKKALAYSSPPGYRRSKPASHPVIDGVIPIIDSWLTEDQKRPRKQRHTAFRVYQRLREEHGFPGSYSSVSRYLKRAKANTGEVFFPLQFDPGEEMQVDWGEGWYLENGVERKVSLFCARLCYSGSSFVRAYERQSQEFFLDGHVRAFDYFGGVARRVAYDNLKTAVVWVGRGPDRKLTESFCHLRSHYLFESRFCNVGAANEKGHVENLVKFSQRRFLTPLPEVSGLDALNAHLGLELALDLGRSRSQDGRTIGELQAEERERFLPLPSSPFAACVSQSSFISKQSLFRFDKNDYSVPVQYAHHQAVAKGFVERVELYVGGELVACHPRDYECGRYVLDPCHYLPLLERKPGGLHNGRPFKGEPWGEDFEVMRRELEYRYQGEGTKKFIKVLLLFNRFEVEAVKEAVKLCVRRRAFSEDAVYGVLSYRPWPRLGALDLSHRPDLQLAIDGKAELTAYDRLLEDGRWS